MPLPADNRAWRAGESHLDDSHGGGRAEETAVEANEATANKITDTIASLIPFGGIIVLLENLLRPYTGTVVKEGYGQGPVQIADGFQRSIATMAQNQYILDAVRELGAVPDTVRFNVTTGGNSPALEIPGAWAGLTGGIEKACALLAVDLKRNPNGRPADEWLPKLATVFETARAYRRTLQASPDYAANAAAVDLIFDRASAAWVAAGFPPLVKEAPLAPLQGIHFASTRGIVTLAVPSVRSALGFRASAGPTVPLSPTSPQASSSRGAAPLAGPPPDAGGRAFPIVPVAIGAGVVLLVLAVALAA